MHTQAVAVYLEITDFELIAAVSWFVCKVSLKKKHWIFRCKIVTGRDILSVAFSFVQSLLPLSDVCRDQQRNITGWWKARFFMGYLSFYKKNEGIIKACISFLFPGPVGAMYQSVGKCFRMHLEQLVSTKFPGGASPSITFIKLWHYVLPLW